jgi:serine-type D-Ala-D-Ala carboxypeptidase (penicillin-binding protein 5/6)
MRAAIAALIAALPLAAAAAGAPLTDHFPGMAKAYAVAIDGQPTWGAAMDMPRQPASLAKLLTALVLLEQPGWSADADVRVSAAAAGIEGSRIGLRVNEVLRAGDLLTGMLVRSGNDACLALVENAAASMGAFASMMNARAAALGMRASHFVHPCGLDGNGQRTTARDLLKLGEAARLQKAIAMRAGAESARVSTRAGREIRFHNSNALIGRDPLAVGLKSGFTSQAGNCLIALGERDGHYVIIVLLDAPNRWWEVTSAMARALARASPRPRLE